MTASAFRHSRSSIRCTVKVAGVGLCAASRMLVMAPGKSAKDGSATRLTWIERARRVLIWVGSIALAVGSIWAGIKLAVTGHAPPPPPPPGGPY